jgi:predicted nuclease with RNAse H fold
MQENIIIGIDLAGVQKNPTGWASWKNKVVSTCHLYEDKEILEQLTKIKPVLVAIDAPLSLPKESAIRKSDREMYRRGYPVFPPRFPAMEKLTLRARKITQQIKRGESHIIEVHPTSTRKALKMPTKDWREIQSIFVQLGLEGDLKTRVLTSHEIDAVTAALTGYLHLQGKTELIGNEEEGYIVVPKKGDWRRLKL